VTHKIWRKIRWENEGGRKVKKKQKYIETTGRQEKGTLTTKESRAVGRVSIYTNKEYAKAAGLQLSSIVLILSI